jgi:DNA-3-methyladenine glycosylase II
MSEIIINHFKKNDPVLHAVITPSVSFNLNKSKDIFFSLVESIISQQLSVKASNTIVKRFIDLFPHKKVTPEQTLQLSREQLRQVGMSWSKADYVQNIARAIIEKKLDIQHLDSLPDEEVTTQLTQIKGIGQWTAEMFLMFTLGREDIFSTGDVGLQNAIQALYKFKNKPSPKELIIISEKWKPYRTYACRILWMYKDNPPKTII